MVPRDFYWLSRLIYLLLISFGPVTSVARRARELNAAMPHHYIIYTPDSECQYKTVIMDHKGHLLIDDFGWMCFYPTG